MFNKVPYDPYKDFEPVTLAVAAPTVLSVNPSVPAKTVQELVALIRANPGKYSFASGGVGTQPHLVGEVRLRCGSMWKGASGGALAQLARGVASTRSPLHIIPISANGPPQNRRAQHNQVGTLALPRNFDAVFRHLSLQR